MSQPLLQQELIESPPARRIIVPPGHSAWWGVDPSTVRVAVSGVRAPGGPPTGSPDRWAASRPFAREEGLRRLSDIYDETRLFTLMLCDSAFPYPGIVYVERPASPASRGRNYELDYAVGAIVAAMDSALYQETGHRVRFEEVMPSHWKLVACGRGNLHKPTKKKLGRAPVFADYGVALWAQENGYRGSSWDEADALGIGECARREVALDER